MLELEYPVKLVILMVVIIVVISLIFLFFSQGSGILSQIFPQGGAGDNGQINSQIIDFTGQGKIFPESIEKYCRSCRNMADNAKPEGNSICYSIKGDLNLTYPDSDSECDWICDKNESSFAIISYKWRNARVELEC